MINGTTPLIPTDTLLLSITLVCRQNVSVGLGLWFDDNVSQYIMTVASKVAKDCMVRRRR